VQPQAIVGVETEPQQFAHRLGGIPVAGVLRREDVADLAGAMLAAVPEQHEVADQLVRLAKFDAYGEYLALVLERRAGVRAGHPFDNLFAGQRWMGDVTADVLARLVGVHRIDVVRAERAQGEPGGVDGVGGFEHQAMVAPPANTLDLTALPSRP
jgi:hypothetical protein